MVEITFWTEVWKKRDISRVLEAFGIKYEPRDPDPRSPAASDPGRYYEFIIEYDPPTLASLERSLAAVGVPRVGHRYFFRFTDEEYETSPLYKLGATGNTPRAFLKSDGTRYKFNTLCPACGLQCREQESPLVIDTRKMGKQYMAWVDGEFLVVSERMAALLNEWGLSGYVLRNVTHAGPEKGQQTVFQLVPTNVLPPWSRHMRFLYPAHLEQHRCPMCGLRGRLEYPYHYDRDVLTDIKDFNIASDWTVLSFGAVHSVLVSANFRKRVLDSGIAVDARYTRNPGDRHWFFEPVVVV